MATSIENPFPVFFDNDGKPLNSGYIYIGQAGLNPEVSPVDVYWDAAFLYPAAQPIRTINGLPSRDGSPSSIYIKNPDYSVVVKNKNEITIYSVLSSIGTHREYVSDMFADLDSAIATIGPTEATLFITTPLLVTANAIVPSTMQLKFLRGGSLNNGTKTVTINGSVDAGLFQIFDGTGAITFGVSASDFAYPQWWGDNTTPGTTDMSPKVQAAVDSGIPVKAVQDIYRLDSSITLPTSGGSVIVGDGRGLTIFRYYGSGIAFDKAAGASQGQGLTIKECSVSNYGTGTTAFKARKENFIILRNFEVTAESASTPWTTACVDLGGDVTDQQYNHSLYDCDLNFGAIGLSASSQYSNEIQMFGGRIRLCGIGAKIDETSGVKFYGTNFSALSTDYGATPGNGKGIHVLNGGDVQSFGSRFETMLTAYDNEGATNNIMSVADIISSTSITNYFYDTDAVAINFEGVTIFPRRSGDVTELLVSSLRARGDSLLALENTASANTVEVACRNSFTETFRIRNITQAVDLLIFNRAGTQWKIGTNSPVLEWRASLPGSGAYTAGDIIMNTGFSYDGSNMHILGWRRLTTGSAHVLNTDWKQMNVSSVSPAT